MPRRLDDRRGGFLGGVSSKTGWFRWQWYIFFRDRIDRSCNLDLYHPGSQFVGWLVGVQNVDLCTYNRSAVANYHRYNILIFFYNSNKFSCCLLLGLVCEDDSAVMDDIVSANIILAELCNCLHLRAGYLVDSASVCSVIVAVGTDTLAGCRGYSLSTNLAYFCWFHASNPAMYALIRLYNSRFGMWPQLKTSCTPPPSVSILCKHAPPYA